MSADLFYFNGVDATTGGYLLPPAPADAVARRARGFELAPLDLDELRYRHELATEKVLGPGEGRDASDLAQVGWGVVFAEGCDPAVRQALRKLLDHRRGQATAEDPDFYKEFWGEDGYRPGESKASFLARHGAGPGPVDPRRVPYYLLVVGDGREIPFGVQYQLDVQYAVGRLSFETPEEYRRYAAGVVAAETSGVRRARELAFFAPEHAGDPATGLSRTELVEPLARQLAAEHDDWEVRTAVAEGATKSCLLDLIGGDAAPALLFTAGHGLGWPSGDPHQPARQGALVCQDWAGPDGTEPLSEDEYLWAENLSDDAHVHGLVAFLFACFGAGTPEWDDFAARTGSAERDRLAPAPLMSALPRRLLAHPGGGALAVAGHVDRAWGYSFSWPGAGRQTEVYRSCLARLLRGHPIGSAFDYVNQRYAELSSDLSTALEEVKYGRRADSLLLSTMWTANNDARGFVVLGDPAVRLFSPLRPQRDGDATGTVRVQQSRGDPGAPGAGDEVPGPDAREAVERLAEAAADLATAVNRVTAGFVDEQPSGRGSEDARPAAAGRPEELRELVAALPQLLEAVQQAVAALRAGTDGQAR